MDSLTIAVVIFFYVFSLSGISIAVDTIAVNQQIRDGETIISAGGSFELGFFSTGNSKNRFLGIRYKKVATGTVAWVANRQLLITDSTGVLKLTDQGKLVLVNGTNFMFWSSMSSRSTHNPIAQLLESGNLVIRNRNDTDPENFLWQSFDYPSSTLLPGMKLGRNRVTSLDRFLSSWKSSDDPSIGNFKYVVDPIGLQSILMQGSEVIFRTGPWIGLRFSGIPEMRPNPVFKYDFDDNEKEVYYTFELVNSSVISRLELNPKGDVQRLVWIDRTQGWTVYATAEKDDCDVNALCGEYATCDINGSPRCGCMKGFVPKFPDEWNSMDWSGGCHRRTALDCRNDGFLKYPGIKLPDTRNSKVNKSMNLKECRSFCLRECSCTAYSSWNISEGGSGCLLWFDNLTDIKELSNDGQELYVRMAASEIDAFAREKSSKRRLVIISSVSTIGMVLLSLVFTLCIFKKKKQLKLKGKISIYNLEGSESEEDLVLRSFNLATISNATNNFSNSNKLGQGGFGPVYKGTLPNGKEIAVKRLSKFSIQGFDEFKNEVIYMSKLQHRNLVKLLGCCIHGEEKMLIYEYMPNKSLNYFIFDQEQSMILDWPKRFLIINGIARGLLYLHQDSRLRIIHRDIKTDNILLDGEMNPKISDFGMARSFGDEIEANTNTVVGTYGYMSPEYAIAGLFSTKSDVYSFGVLVLEIVSGKRNRGFYHPNPYVNLLGHAWTLHMEGRSLEIVDAPMGDTYNLSEALRSIHVGLLCVQRSPDDRPSMSSVILMLGSEGALPQPKEPGFFSERHVLEVNSNSEATLFSGNEQISTILEA